jgi:hypothetical protein
MQQQKNLRDINSIRIIIKYAFTLSKRLHIDDDL